MTRPLINLLLLTVMISSDHTTLMYIQGKYFLNKIGAYRQTSIMNLNAKQAQILLTNSLMVKEELWLIINRKCKFLNTITLRGYISSNVIILRNFVLPYIFLIYYRGKTSPLFSQRTFTFATCECLLHTRQFSWCGHPIDVLQFNSILTLSTVAIVLFHCITVTRIVIRIIPIIELSLNMNAY